MTVNLKAPKAFTIRGKVLAVKGPEVTLDGEDVPASWKP